MGGKVEQGSNHIFVSYLENLSFREVQKCATIHTKYLIFQSGDLYERVFAILETQAGMCLVVN